MERENFWFTQNLKKILEARKTQSFFEDNTLYLTKNRNYNFSQFLRKLDKMGYEKVYQVSEPGEFSQGGGVVDLFPINPVVEQAHYGAGLNFAVRIEFFGNKIKNITLLDIKIENKENCQDILVLLNQKFQDWVAKSGREQKERLKKKPKNWPENF